MTARVTTQTKKALADFLAGKKISIAADLNGVHRTTLWRAIKRHEKEKEKAVPVSEKPEAALA